MRFVPLRAPMLLGVALLFQLVVGAPATVLAESVRDPLWVKDGEVRAVAYKENSIFIGGAFSRVDPAIGGFATFDATSGASVTPFAGVAGTVNTIIPDGAGGYYVGGSFTGIKGQPRSNLAAVDAATGGLAGWSPSPNGAVKSLLSGVYFLRVGRRP